ncbi:MAG: DNA polymerase III subunit delta [Bacteroidota bacterium]
MSTDQIINELKKKIFRPVYFLQGEEPFYIDQISDFIEKNVLSESEKEFNQTVLYGKDIDAPTLISYAKRYPMMSSHQVVIVKEAQDMKSLINKEKEKDKGKEKDAKDPLLEYILKPTQSTILVFCFKYKTLDKRTKLAKTIEKNALLFDSKRLYDNQLPDWINGYVLSQGYRIGPAATKMMAEYLGNDLSKIANEISKVILSLKAGDEITAAMVEENIGISKEFNIFELQSALGKRNIFKANQIVNYFAANSKSNPTVLTTSQLYNYFLKVLQFHQVDHRSGETPAAALGVHPYFIKDYESAARAYSLDTCIRNISFIREFDTRSKGISSATTNDGELLKELVYKILH